MQPIKIKVVENKEIYFLWDDGLENTIALKELRKKCPCATCLAEIERQSKTYIPVFSVNQITVKSINQVGKYAIQITWKDGHNTGIYEYKFLKNFSK